MASRVVRVAWGAALLRAGAQADEACTAGLLQVVRREVFDCSADALERFSKAMEPRAEDGNERFLVIMARDIVAGLLGILEALYLQACWHSGCASCGYGADLVPPPPPENAGSAGAVDEVDRLMQLAGADHRFRRLNQALLLFLFVFDSAVTVAEEDSQTRRTPSPLLGRNVSSEAIRAELVELHNERTAESLDLVLVGSAQEREQAGDAGRGHATSMFPQVVHTGCDMLRALHRQVKHAFQLMPLLAIEARHLPPGGSTWGFPPYATYLRWAGAATIMDAFVVQRGERRAFWPFARGSPLCDRAELQGPSGPSFLQRPRRDPMLVNSWVGASAFDLLQLIERSGRALSYTYWAVREPMQFHEPPGCDVSAGHLYDPTLCLDKKGWGGSVYYINPDPTPAVGQRLYFQWHPRAWNSERYQEDPVWAARMDPMIAPSEPMDVLVFSPMTGNCALLRELLTADSMTMARLVYAPINPSMPPPIEVEPNFTEFWLVSHTTGRSMREATATEQEPVEETPARIFLAQCSLESVDRMLRPIGYELLFVEHVFAVYAHMSVAALLRRHHSAHQKAVAAGGLEAARAEAISPFDAWRRGWYCSPVSRMLLDLEAHARFDPEWLDPAGSRGRPSLCAFLERYAFLDEETLRRAHGCAGPTELGAAAPGAEAPPSDAVHAVGAQGEGVQRRLRAVWAADGAHPALGLKHVLGRGARHSSSIAVAGHASRGETESGGAPNARGGGAIGGAAVRSTCGRQTPEACECVQPWRGSTCSQEDSSNIDRARDYEAAFVYVLSDAVAGSGHEARDLRHALRSLWEQFNDRHGYPVLVFHTGLDRASRERLALSAPHRLWFFPIAGGLAAGAFQAGPLFLHPAIAKLDLVWLLDAARPLAAPVQGDPFLRLHAIPSATLAHGGLADPSPGAARHDEVWEYAQLYSLRHGTPAPGAADRPSHSARSTAGAPVGRMHEVDRRRVLPSGCVLARVAALGAGGPYQDFLAFVRAHAGAQAGAVLQDPGVLLTAGAAAVGWLTGRGPGSAAGAALVEDFPCA